MVSAATIKTAPGRTSAADAFLTLAEVAERLKINEDTVRRLSLNEPGVVVICFPRKGKRVYRKGAHSGKVSKSVGSWE